MTDQTDISQERALAKSLIELREVYTRVRLLLPSLSLQEMLVLSGAVEQAKTAGMKAKSLPTATAQAAAKPETEENGPSTSTGLTVTIDGSRTPLITAVRQLITEFGPLSTRDIIGKFEEKGWTFNSRSTHPGSILRGALKRSDLGQLNENGFIKFRLKDTKSGKPPASKKGKKTAWQARRDDRAASRDQILKALSTVREPITIAQLAAKMGRSNGQGIVPVMMSLAQFGAVKKSTKGDETFWEPNRDSIKEYASQFGASVFTKGDVALLNGSA